MTIIIAAMIGAVLIYLLLILPTQWVKVEKVNHSIGLGKRILQISDLHVDMLRVSPARLVKIIRDVNPDYVFLTGDYTFREYCLPRLEEYLDGIASCGIPAYGVLGNHDYELPRMRQLIGMFRARHIPILRNECITLPDFYLVGIDDYCTGRSRIERAYREVPSSPDRAVIVITHDPNVLLYMNKPFSYLVAGHLHGKQLNIPWFFKFKSKGPLPARGIYKGLHHHPYEVFYISKGIGQAGMNARFMVRSEVTIHEL